MSVWSAPWALADFPKRTATRSNGASTRRVRRARFDSRLSRASCTSNRPAMRAQDVKPCSASEITTGSVAESRTTERAATTGPHTERKSSWSWRPKSPRVDMPPAASACRMVFASMRAGATALETKSPSSFKRISLAEIEWNSRTRSALGRSAPPLIPRLLRTNSSMVMRFLTLGECRSVLSMMIENVRMCTASGWPKTPGSVCS
mmetsp:Transcript_41699/g.98969  ORF Transcript_41699/g.98969 Transcript_41699/m.98969 type:complete len:205 (+) Transcript_41699:62-676(+)